MTSTTRAEANLRNSASSNGPRTISGKSRTRLNAVTHGLTAETLILPGEDPRAFQRRLDDWTAQLEPANPFEHDLVRQVVTLSWRLDRADRVQDALIADSLGTDTAEQRRAEVADLGRRLLPPPRVPNFVRRLGVWADLDRLAHRGPDDPDDPPRLLLRLEATADGCRWLLDRWAVLRTIVDAGTPWSPEPMVQAIRLLGKRPFDAVDDLQVPDDLRGLLRHGPLAARPVRRVVEDHHGPRGDLLPPAAAGPPAARGQAPLEGARARGAAGDR